jgi:prevent-host-death family protein
MTVMIPLADAKARLSAVLDDVRDTHDRVVITRNGRPEAVIISVTDLETIEETLDLLSTPGARLTRSVPQRPRSHAARPSAPTNCGA